ncbi:MAG: fatty acid desaturase [Planctomycetota bacterium]
MSTVIDPKRSTAPQPDGESAGEVITSRVDGPHVDVESVQHAGNVATPTAEDADSQSSLVAQKAAKKFDRARPTKEDRVRFTNISWWAVGWLTLAHALCFLAPLTFTWEGLVVALTLHWVAGSLGICLGYHRLLTHKGMKTHDWVRYVFAGIGCFAGEGTPLDWVADHRKHHAHSDQEGDPHSPREGSIWSHMFWLAFHTHNGDREAYLKRWVPDLFKDPVMHLFDMLFLPINIAVGFVLFGAGYAYGGIDYANSFLIWGLFVRLVTVLHATWLVNSASHMFGYQNYETVDDSRNNWLVAIIAYGEGWHNNHHAYPRMAVHGHKWWEFDITWQAIKLLRATGLVWDVVDYRTAAERRAKAKQAA